MPFPIITPATARFGNIYVSAAVNGNLDIFLTREDRQLKPFAGLPDHFQLCTPVKVAPPVLVRRNRKPVATPAPVGLKIRWRSPKVTSSKYDNEQLITDPQALVPLVQKMVQRDASPNRTVEEALMNANGLIPAMSEMVATTATEMAHYPQLNFYSENKGHKFYAQYFQDFGATLEALADWLKTSAPG